MSTKICPKCNSTALVLIATQYHKLCNSCGFKIEWLLDEGQKPLITNNRVKVKE